MLPGRDEASRKAVSLASKLITSRISPPEKVKRDREESRTFMLWFQEFSTETINETSNRLATSMSGALRGEALVYPHIIPTYQDCPELSDGGRGLGGI